MLIVVLGTARTGTSMTAGILQRLGVFMGAAPSPTQENAKGAIEDAGFVKLTQQAVVSGVNQAWTDRAKALIAKRSDQLWGFKSALTHYCLGDFLPLLPKDRKFVVTSRSPHSTAQSYIVHQSVRYGKTLGILDSLHRITQSNMKLAQALLLLRGESVHFVTFEDLKSRPLEVARRLAKFVDPQIPEGTIAYAAEFVDRSWTTIACSDTP